MENSQKTFRRAQNVTDRRRSVADYLIPVTSNVRLAAAINATNGWRHRRGYRRSHTDHTFAHQGVEARPAVRWQISTGGYYVALKPIQALARLRRLPL